MTDDHGAPVPRADDPVVDPAPGDAPATASADRMVGPDWEWRRRIRANPATHRVYRIAIGVVGFAFVAGGLLLVPLPGPGWLIVFFGVAIWATEFEWAGRLLDFGKAKLRAWEQWLRRQPRIVQGLVALATFAFVAAVVWVTLKVTGLPGFVPAGLATWLQANIGL